MNTLSRCRESYISCYTVAYMNTLNIINIEQGCRVL